MIFITGASAGIGEACATKFAEEGRDLFLVARRGEKLQTLSEQLSTQHQVKVIWASLDISDRKAVDAFATTHKETLQKVSVLINNAGLAKGLSTFQDGKVSDWEVMLDTNVKGLLYITHLLLPVFLKNHQGHIINLGSVAGHWVYPKGNIYCATKAAVHSLTEAMRIDLCGTPIRVTEISPGMVETEFSLSRLQDPERAKAVYAGMIPLNAVDVAEAVVWSVNRPLHVNIQEIVFYPTDQASPTIVHRR